MSTTLSGQQDRLASSSARSQTEAPAMFGETPPTLSPWSYERHPVLWMLLAFAAAFALLFCRRPDALLHPRFYAEDGAIWYATAYNYGWWRVLLSPYQGYVHLLPRLMAGVALLFPIRYAPLVGNLTAITIETLPVLLLISPRSSVWGSLRVRLLLSALYLLLPNTEEVLGCITESQWIVALCVILILLATPPASRLVRTGSLVLLLIGALTGPFSIFFLPVGFYQLLRGRDKYWCRTVLLILTGGASAQILSFLLHSANRYRPALGANPAFFVRILAGQVYFGVLIGPNLLGTSLSLAILCMAVAGTTLVVACFFISNDEIRIFMAVAAALFAAALATPIAFPAPGHTAWEALCSAPGAHYWFFPCLAFLWSLVFCANSGSKSLRLAGTGLLMLGIVGLIQGFEYPLASDRGFPSYAQTFQTAAKGTEVSIPLAPAGWHAVLIKH